MSTDLGYYRHPTISGDTVVFVTEDDLWTVPLAGGAARRLTANPGTITFPGFSPDGSKIAFTSRDEGHSEAWIMDAEGGPPTRLTYLGARSQVVGWSRDGKRVIVSSDWQQPFIPFPPEAGRPEPSRSDPRGRSRIKPAVPGW
jgi:tricorn protease